MSQNFNVYPWYDDFDPSKNFHRVLFKPGVAVQARELTQSQTILQNQISNFADSIFSQNTPVSGGKITVNTGCYFIKLNTQYNNVNIVAADFLNKTVVSSDGQIVAKVIATAEGTTVDAPTLIVNYLSGDKFTDETNIFDSLNPNLAATTVGTAGGTTCTGPSSAASITDGIFYIVNGYSQSSTQNSDGSRSKYSIGNFVSVQPQTVVLEKYSNTPTYRIGLSITETVVDYIDDSSLLDPAVGASNYQAPGADRYQITLTLVTLPLDIGNDDQFIELVRVSNGSVQKQVDSTVYSVIDDYFAKRTKETNGDYIVNDFRITPSANSINPNTYTLSVGPGVAYVNGYRAENQSTVKIESNRARTTSSVNNNINTLDYGNYIYVTGLMGQNGGFFDTTTCSKVDFHTVAASDVLTTNTTTYTSTQVGSAYLRALTYTPSADETNASTYVYKAHLFDITSNVLSGNVASATSSNVTFSSTGGKFSNVNGAYVGVKLSIDSGPGAGDVTTIVAYNGATKTATVNPSFTSVPSSSSTFSLRFAVKDIETMVRANTNYTLLANSSVSLLGKVGGIASGDTKLLEPGSNKLIYPLGNPFVSSVSDSSYTTVQEFRAQYFGTASPSGCKKILELASFNEDVSFEFISSGAVESIDAIKENFIVVNEDTGQIVDFTTEGRSIAVTQDTVTFIATDVSPFTGTIYAKVAVNNGNDTSLVLKTKTLVTANTLTASSTGPDGIIDGVYLDLNKGQIWIPNNELTYGQKQSLYVSDIKRIVKIIDTQENIPTVNMLSTGLDITSHFDFNNGQTDNYYGHGSITLKPGRPTPASIWILFDHYEHSGGDGYFSAASYTNIGVADRPTYTATDGTVYQLKDCLDFRPAVKNAQSDFVFKYKVEPTTHNASGLFLPASGTQFTTDYTYYLGRKDVLFIGKDKGVTILEGTPSVNPILPSAPEGSLVLANITLDPYTAYLPGDGSGFQSSVTISPVLHKRWAFSDITNLQTRVNNLEYYASLNLLEQNAASLQIPDANGLNRFKNGILVDDFSTFSVGDTYNPDFSASINTRSQFLSPALLVKNYVLQNQHLMVNPNLSASSITGLNYTPIKNGKSGFYMLNYTEDSLISQPLASRTTNVNPGSIGSPVGVINLTPPMDNWIDNTAQPDTLFVDPNLKAYQASNQLNLLEGNPTLGVADWKSIPGTRVSIDDGTYTTVTEQRSNQYTYGYWSQTYNQVGDYLTNISILPYIRSQHLTFQASGMLFNTKVNAFFDGKRVTRLCRKPNIVELRNVTGTFKQGDTIGYLNETASFRKTGEVLDVYKYPDGRVRLYVIDDNSSITYTLNGSSTGTVVNGQFNTAGAYQGSTATGTYVSSTHYSGATPTTQTEVNTVILSSKASSTDIYTGLEFWIVSGSETGLTSIPNGLKATIIAYNTSTKQITLDRTISYTQGDIYSIGPMQTNEVGNVSGIFFLPGNYFHTGQRTFRLDNRVVQQTETEFVYSNGSETTSAEANFYAEGLATTSQGLYVAPSVSTAKNTATTVQTANYQISKSVDYHGGGGGCCVIATALNNQGEWENSQKAGLIEWCEAKLHDKWWGETLRRGYQVIGSKVIVPNMKNRTFRKYVKWQFGNATNMLRGKSFNPLSVPAGLVWITAMVVTGAVVSKRFATKCWTSLYKK
jgi:hypothetical protein